MFRTFLQNQTKVQTDISLRCNFVQVEFSIRHLRFCWFWLENILFGLKYVFWSRLSNFLLKTPTAGRLEKSTQKQN